MTSAALFPIEPLGDAALLVRLGDAIDEVTHVRVRQAHSRLRHLPPALGGCEVVPAFTTVAVHFDLARGTYAALAAAVAAALADLEHEPLPASRTITVPVRYGGGHGPDLEYVAAQAGLTPEEVVRRHAAGAYLVHMIGFAPGFPYLGGLDPRLACPRRETPRTHVPAGSVGIGGSQTGIYPFDSPGGWQLIGRTDLVLFAADREPASLLAAGDRVRFREVSR
ncbi:MAG: 5-oxoprolinase subunit PxpB [Gemmatimonadetes bacterium]|nr:5-oxoprolinase subunit PxpB [Gemmatimonadota bacterium]